MDKRLAKLIESGKTVVFVGTDVTTVVRLCLRALPSDVSVCHIARVQENNFPLADIRPTATTVYATCQTETEADLAITNVSIVDLADLDTLCKFAKATWLACNIDIGGCNAISDAAALFSLRGLPVVLVRNGVVVGFK